MVFALILSLLSVSSDPARFHQVDPDLARGEAKFAETFNSSGNLALIDLFAWQSTNAVLAAEMGTDPLKTGTVPPKFLSAADLPQGLVFRFDGVDYLVLPERVAEELVPEPQVINLKDLLQSLFARLTTRTEIVLACSAMLLLLVSMTFGLRKGLTIFLPPVLAVAASAVTLGLVGETLTLFHLLSFFLIFGLGVDYAIFRNRIVFYSFLTSLVGFGLLAFTSFPPTAAIGKTIAIGLTYAYLLSLVGGKRESESRTEENWAARKEQAAGKLRLKLTFALYRLFGKSFCKICAFFVVASAYPAFRRRCPFAKALSFSFGLLDKLDACTLRKNLPRMTVVGDKTWMKGGCFLLSTHVGTIEVLPALENVDGIVVHAFQQMTHNKLFTEMFMRHFDKNQFVLHPVEEIGVETAVEMQEAIQRGEMVLMAGDRDPASGGKKGVFKFAKLMESPVYAITCIRTGWNAYTVNAKELDRRAIQSEYDAFLSAAAAAHPNEHFEF